MQKEEKQPYLEHRRLFKQQKESERLFKNFEFFGNDRKKLNTRKPWMALCDSLGCYIILQKLTWKGRYLLNWKIGWKCPRWKRRTDEIIQV